MATTERADAKFKVGDRVRYRAKGESRVLTVAWVSKCGSLIATENNGYCNPYACSSIYEAA